ncbi:MAG: hypothetical protein EBT52_02155 [Flavobacteriia bacterium]|nr:hypothetical protein [Flavobacteriia bacterium]
MHCPVDQDRSPIREGPPSPSLLRSCLRAGDVPIHCMLRPRPGGFVYSKEEMDRMQDELLQFKEDGAAGVVFGCLNAAHEVDAANTRLLTEHAHSLGLEATFHRAFDHLKDFQKGLDQLIEIGVDRILTSVPIQAVEFRSWRVRVYQRRMHGASLRLEWMPCISLHTKRAGRMGCLKEWVIATARIQPSGSRSKRFSLESAAFLFTAIALVLYNRCP